MSRFCDQPSRNFPVILRCFANRCAMRGAWIIVAALLAAPALANTANGADKWKAGDWRGAVAAWQTPAQRGDTDAMFNLGQAYLLGRGVDQDRDAAIDLFRRAAARGHLAATASLGIALWQDGKRTEALQYLRTAADKGELRAAYVLGVATFSGDSVPRNPALGYAYIARARDGGLEVARQQAGRYATLMSADERARGEAAAQALASGSPVTVALAGYQPKQEAAPVQVAAADNEDDDGDGEDGAAAPKAVRKPVKTAEKPAPEKPAPEKTAAKTADKKTPEKKPAEKTAEKTPAKGKGKAAEATADAEPAKEKAADAKGYRVQLGAYNSDQAAKSAWTTLVSQQAVLLKGKKPSYLPKGGLIRLQVGPFAERDDARDLCQKLSAAGRPCFVTS